MPEAGRSRPVGVVEGFYGDGWGWQDRVDCAQFLAGQSLGTYVYAPKSDRYLRSAWRDPWPGADYDKLHVCTRGVTSQGVHMGVGLSPIGLGNELSDRNRQALRAKLDQVSALSPSILCVLFDDVETTGDDMAEQQLRVVDVICDYASFDRVIVCPSYYSTDPVLERVFGARAGNYWSQLSKGLDASIDLFWTGERVCSNDYSRASLDKAAELLGRPPVIWDNYPVNDGEKSCGKLFLQSFSGRELLVTDAVAGHLANPMRQPVLSRLPLVTMAALHAGMDTVSMKLAAEKFLEREAPGLIPLITRDAERFASAGLDGLGDKERERLSLEYQSIEHPMAAEVVGWLQGRYAFDPACLTG